CVILKRRERSHGIHLHEASDPSHSAEDGAGEPQSRDFGDDQEAAPFQPGPADRGEDRRLGTDTDRAGGADTGAAEIAGDLGPLPTLEVAAAAMRRVRLAKDDPTG